jgi:hypothetical protein
VKVCSRYDGPVPALDPTPELWERLRALDKRCDITMVRHRIKVPYLGSEYKVGERVWMVCISLEGGKPIDIWKESEYLVNAMEWAIEEAEERGWHEAA